MDNIMRVNLFFRFIISVSLACLGFSFTAIAQEFPPKKTITMVVGFAAGGASDNAARIIAKKLSEDLGQNVIVDNKPGAGGNIAHAYTATAPADGSVILLGSIGPLSIAPHLMKLSYDPQKDLAPLTMGMNFPNVLVVIPELGVKNLKEFVALAKKTPGQITFASTGIGSASHLQGELFNVRADIDTVHVPYKGGVLAVNDLLAGHIQMVFSDMAPAMAHIKAGKLRAIAVTSAQRAAALPDVPTMIESGLAGFESGVWWSIVAPKGTPVEIVNRVNTELGKMIQLPEVRETYAKLGVNTQHSTPAKVVESIRAESPVMAKILKAAGVEAE